MPVSAYVIRCLPADLPSVLDQLHELPSVIVGDPTNSGIPVVTDTPTTRAAAELGERLQQMNGVKAAVLVYHNFEDVADAMELPARPQQPACAASSN